MGKNLNPADSYRKAQRKKELKKNKAGRAKARDLAVVKKDTTDLEDVISELESSREDPQKLAELKAELEGINKKKAEYVAEHPEARRLVYRRRKQGEPEPELPTKRPRNYFNKNGLPKHPERSIYYDPVMNPYGVAPPGMAYAERPLLPGEVDSEAESEEDDDIPIPDDLPPGTEEVASDDEIPMPDGPPPGRQESSSLPLPVSLSMQPPFAMPPPMPSGQFFAGVPPPPPGFAAATGMPPPPYFGATMPPNWNGVPPPPPPGFPTMPNTAFPPSSLPPPPPNFFPRQQNVASIQDPLATIPHQTFQAHRASQHTTPSANTHTRTPLPVNASLPAKPVAAAQMAAATISAEPELRDLKREATEFVPTAVKRKKVAASGPKMNAAPSVGPSADDEDDESKQARPDLVSALKSQFGGGNPPSSKPEAKSDYDKFLDDMGDILADK